MTSPLAPGPWSAWGTPLRVVMMWPFPTLPTTSTPIRMRWAVQQTVPVMRMRTTA